MVRHIDVYPVPAVDDRAWRPEAPDIRHGLAAPGRVSEGLFRTRRAITADPVIGHCTSAIRVDSSAEGECGRANPGVADIVHRCHHGSYRKVRFPADDDPGPDCLVGVHTHTKQIPVGVAQHPVAMVGSGAVRRGEVDAEIDGVAGVDITRQRNHGRTIHPVAAVKDQGVAGRPGTGARVLQSPDFGK